MQKNQLFRFIHNQLGKKAGLAGEGEARCGCAFKCLNPHKDPNSDGDSLVPLNDPSREPDELVEDSFAMHLCADGHLTATVISECHHMPNDGEGSMLSPSMRDRNGRKRKRGDFCLTGNGHVFPDPAVSLYTTPPALQAQQQQLDQAQAAHAAALQAQLQAQQAYHQVMEAHAQAVLANKQIGAHGQPAIGQATANDL